MVFDHHRKKLNLQKRKTSCLSMSKIHHHLWQVLFFIYILSSHNSILCNGRCSMGSLCKQNCHLVIFILCHEFYSVTVRKFEIFVTYSYFSKSFTVDRHATYLSTIGSLLSTVLPISNTVWIVFIIGLGSGYYWFLFEKTVSINDPCKVSLFKGDLSCFPSYLVYLRK